MEKIMLVHLTKEQSWNRYACSTTGGGGGGGGGSSAVERATPGKEVPGSIPAVAARSLLVGSVSV